MSLWVEWLTEPVEPELAEVVRRQAVQVAQELELLPEHLRGPRWEWVREQAPGPVEWAQVAVAQTQMDQAARQRLVLAELAVRRPGLLPEDWKMPMQTMPLRTMSSWTMPLWTVPVRAFAPERAEPAWLAVPRRTELVRAPAVWAGGRVRTRGQSRAREPL